MSVEVYDVEIKMHAFRLLRSGKYTTAKAIRRAVGEDFPKVEVERIDRVLSELAQSLLEEESR